MLFITTLEAWQGRGPRENPPGGSVDHFVPADGQAAWAPDDRSALAVADELFPAGTPCQVIVVTFDPAPARIPQPGIVDRSSAAEIRYARRDPAGRHVALLRRPSVAAALDLLPHPEGGWFRETWSTAVRFTPEGYPGERAAATGIYFLLPPGEESVWHAVRSDEVWLWHRGGPLTLLLGGAGDRPDIHTGQRITLGPEVEKGQLPQALVPAGVWQAARPATTEEVLVSCVVSPGFDFADFRV